jgi:prepilin-type N-terminal cleavage/methylation domain-containing protein
MNFKKLLQKNSKKAGFTIMELVTVIAIFGIFSGIVIFKYSDFNDGVKLFNLTQDVGLHIKQAQNSAILGQYPRASHDITVEDFSNWKPKYGVYFNTNSDDRFWYFFDENVDDMFIPGNDAIGGGTCVTQNTECLDEVVIATGEKIHAICNGLDCSLPQISLMFERPFPDLVATDNGGQDQSDPLSYNSSITIIIKGDQNEAPTYRGITVTPLGQISIDFVNLEDFGLSGDGNQGDQNDGGDTENDGIQGL